MAQTITIPITREKLESKRKDAAAQGFDLPTQDSGEVYYSKANVTADYSYDGQVLTITIKKKPFYLFAGVIESALKSFFA